MKFSAWITLGLLAAVFAGSIFGLWKLQQQDSERAVDDAPRGPLVLYCAASNRAAMEEIIQAYRLESGREVQVEYGPSQTLLSRIEVVSQGDLFIPADDSFLNMAHEKGLIAERIPIASMKAVVAVPKGNPKAIDSWDDLLLDSVRLVQASPDAAAIGKVTRKQFTDSGNWDRFEAATVAFRGTVNDVANDVKIGAADAGVVYDAVLATYPELEAVEIDELSAVQSQVEVAVLNSTSSPRAALHLARFIAASDRGLEIYRKYKFKTVQGDPWVDRPSLSLFAGSMLRPAIEDTIKKFQEREGVDVTTVYNGCGILVGQMKTGQRPDAYFACDVEFMKQVADLFPEPINVSQNQLVIVVAKGNPHQIASLKDLSRPGLRVGIGHEKQCAMGWITQVTFKEGGVQQEVMKNVTVQSPTGDLLVNQMRAGSLDAAVVYLSNAAGAAEQLDAIEIQGLPCSIATQPWAVYRQSKYPQTASRLFQAIVSPASQADFEAEGFGWQMNQPNP